MIVALIEIVHCSERISVCPYNRNSNGTNYWNICCFPNRYRW